MAFANQYYQILASSPQLLFRFYKEGSTLSRLDHRGEMISVTDMDCRFFISFGLLLFVIVRSTDWVSSIWWCLVNDRKAIKEKLLSVDYSEYKAEIKTVDGYVIIIIKVINHVLSICCSSSSRMDCKHIYEKELVIHNISTKKPHPRCPVAGCPKILQVGRVVCDALLTIEIDEMCLASGTNINSTMVEDFYRS
ncbi:hypothetical protein ZIOFF_009969 [Zingiber officinale]|uniref:NTF2 domain-containing protein n=1 Tax=Zingiber officinale TaxID=94328 RepID=A0A8J5HNJ2_ZINOF|nr:hypothetical protein ZIOFF_009969 [Zingiber officinale]